MLISHLTGVKRLSKIYMCNLSLNPCHDSFSRKKLFVNEANRLRSSLNDKSFSNLALESPVELTDSHLEEIVDVWNRKSRRIVV